MYTAGCFIGRLYIFRITMPVDENGEKVVLSVEGVLLSKHKDVSPEDSDDPQDIGLSSEEEAEDLAEAPHIRRKYHQAPGPPPPPVPEPTPPVTTASTSTSTDTATIQVPVAALEQVHAILGQIISGQNPQVSSSGVTDPQPSGSPPFTVPTPKRGEKQCKLCFRKFWATETLKRHMKTHSGDQKYICPNEGCGRKVASKRGLEVHLST